MGETLENGHLVDELVNVGDVVSDGEPYSDEQGVSNRSFGQDVGRSWGWSGWRRRCCGGHFDRFEGSMIDLGVKQKKSMV